MMVSCSTNLMTSVNISKRYTLSNLESDALRPGPYTCQPVWVEGGMEMWENV